MNFAWLASFSSKFVGFSFRSPDPVGLFRWRIDPNLLKYNFGVSPLEFHRHPICACAIHLEPGDFFLSCCLVEGLDLGPEFPKDVRAYACGFCLDRFVSGCRRLSKLLLPRDGKIPFFHCEPFALLEGVTGICLVSFDLK